MPCSKRAGIVKASAISLEQLLAGLDVLGSRVLSSHHIFRLITHARERRRLQGKRLCRRIPFAGNIALWYRAFFNSENGLACVAIENEHQRALIHCDEGRNCLPFLLDGHEGWAGWKVLVPQSVVDRLEIPLQIARVGVNSDHRIAKQTVSGAIAAVIVR